MTLNERFEQLWNAAEGRNAEKITKLFGSPDLINSMRASALRWFLAGAIAEREACAKIVAEIEIPREHAEWWKAIAHAHGRIRQRGEEQVE